MNPLSFFIPKEITPNGERKNYLFLSTLRILFFVIILSFLKEFVDYKIGMANIICFSTLGVIAGNLISFSKIKLKALPLILLIFLVTYNIAFYLLNLIPFSDNAQILFFASSKNYCDLILSIFLATTTSTILFWRIRKFYTLELAIMFLFSISLLAPHRNYQFDALKQISSWAWFFQLSQLKFIIILGAGLFVLLYIYLLLVSLPGKAIPQVVQRKQITHKKRFHPALSSLIHLIMLGILAVVCIGTYSYHQSSILSNGVAQEAEEGMSPLNFHSSLGKSSEPAALVRLEGDYNSNPFAPMIYFRESAISGFNGKEFVIAGSKVDSDVSFTRPEEHYKKIITETHLGREPLTQSIYLLSNHDLAFAVDYPISLVKLSAPKKTKKFKSSYRAYSMVPTLKLEDFQNPKLENSHWTNEEKAHYLKTSTNEKYLKRALKITNKEKPAIDKVLDIVNYLNKNAIYTLTPNHKVTKGQDPVEPFLFGDLRGYCVHFAHATVYMLRSLGVPSRIATGYLSDASQSRDGHILLRMNDRHAWAEIYVDDFGWVPVDTQPEQVENHGETPVDVDLLEELMNLLEPGEEVLPEENNKDEVGLKDKIKLPKFRIKHILNLFLALILTIFLLKLILTQLWRFPWSLKNKIRFGYLSLVSKLNDYGLGREYAETKEDYRKRISDIFNYDILKITEVINSTQYRKNSKLPNQEKVLSMLQDGFKELKSIPFKSKIISFLNPSSILFFWRFLK